MFEVVKFMVLARVERPLPCHEGLFVQRHDLSWFVIGVEVETHIWKMCHKVAQLIDEWKYNFVHEVALA